MLDITTKYIKMSKVNLDALIPREDFEVMKDSPVAPPTLPAISISELENGKFFLTVLRKPDFQRETNEWTPEKICELIVSFLNDDLIPSIILWNSGSRNFIIDGAHRLSALIAWVVDDYGDNVISNAFFGNNIPKGQSDIADKTRKLIKKKIGSYRDHQLAISHANSNGSNTTEILQRAQRLATLTLHLQWVKGNASKAEDSFFKINEEAAPINDTEKTLLRSRSKPNAIAARAIVRSGTGHKYWSKFENNKDEIEQLAKEINQLLFTPILQTPLKTLDIPLAGKGYSSETLSLIVDMINISCGIEKRKTKGKKDIVFYRKVNNEDVELSDDTTGDETIVLLKKTRKVLYRISNDNPASLGLHPVVYFYSSTGRYQVTSFLAIIELINEFESKNNFNEFINVRKDFEDFLIKYKNFVNQSTLKHGSGLKGYKQLKRFFLLVIDSFKEGKKEDEIITFLANSTEYKYLNPNDNNSSQSGRQDFGTETKSSVFLTKALENPIRCEICHGLIHRNSTSIDHIVRKQDGGKGTLENGQLSHPYCNTTYKN